MSEMDAAERRLEARGGKRFVEVLGELVVWESARRPRSSAAETPSPLMADWQWSDPYATTCNDHQAAGHQRRLTIPQHGEELSQYFRTLSGSVAKEDDRHKLLAVREQRAKVVISRHYHPFAAFGLGKDFLIRRLRELQRLNMNCIHSGGLQLSNEPRRKHLVEQQRYLAIGRASRALFGWFSQNRSASWMSSLSRSGKSSRISSSDIPAAIIETTVCTGIRKPRIQGAPPSWSARTVMRGN